ncbi:hypothetical protein NBO_63g0021 [Nosema bombycis CQ1]|uniref:Uncharacterized protein n=1 Tax=Nosema bombycis (strain CQ1 / CVCC 102059) TaxID=578461 RepID=R0KTZ4_NOSB1|nr:hypothetical protein NBO_63g0021 [Nosema bombycis CQ1]|eukprot:EOB13702.1 hypothetical protein NBO_63g0021 [Nosema bombycis CQ1]
MKRIFSTASLGAIVAIVVLGFIVIDYGLLRKKKSLKSSGLRGIEIKTKSYKVDSVTLILSKTGRNEQED